MPFFVSVLAGGATHAAWAVMPFLYLPLADLPTQLPATMRNSPPLGSIVFYPLNTTGLRRVVFFNEYVRKCVPPQYVKNMWNKFEKMWKNVFRGKM
jgi:hypothetical protein